MMYIFRVFTSKYGVGSSTSAILKLSSKRCRHVSGVNRRQLTTAVKNLAEERAPVYVILVSALRILVNLYLTMHTGGYFMITRARACSSWLPFAREPFIDMFDCVLFTRNLFRAYYFIQ